jgi:predicted nucleotide-binding protein
MGVRDATVSIGSSSEGKRYAEYLQAALDDYCESTVWDQGTFGLSESGLHALVSESKRVDFAVLVLTPDDLIVERGLKRPSARDNVVFEVGLFVGALAPQRTFIVRASDVELNLPSDLAGITTCMFRSQRTDANLRAAVNPAALRIREALRDLGTRKEIDVVDDPVRTPDPVRWNRRTILAALSERMGAEEASIVHQLFSTAYPALVG